MLDWRQPPEVRRVVDEASALVPLLRENAARGEAERSLAPECVKALRDAGMFRLTVPKRFDGHDLDVRGQVATIAEVGRGCASAGWLVGIAAISGNVAARFPAEGVEEVFAGSPDTFICSSGGRHNATATKVDGGYRCSGRFATISGCEIADWALLAFMPVVADGSPTGEYVSLLAPTAEADIDRDWHVAGMLATGSHSIALPETFVPDRRALLHTQAPEADGTVPAPARFAIIAHRCLASLVGAAHGALDTVRGMLERGKPLQDTVYTRSLDSPMVQRWLAESTHLVDNGYQHMFIAADEFDAAGVAGSMSREARTRARMHMTSALASSRRAMGLLLDLGGTAGFSSANPLQRYWRDFEVGSHHAHFSRIIAVEDYARALLDIDPTVSTIH